MHNKIAAVIFTLALTACATGYQSSGLTGGFSETQLDQNVFRVSFQGNAFTRPERAEEMTLLRSAELALKNGYSHFVIVSNSASSREGNYTAPTQSYTTANVTGMGNTALGTANTTTSGGMAYRISKPSTTNTIMCFKGRPSDAQGMVYDANFVFNSLGGKYGVASGK